jgi:5-methyltetrahydropteroyltriglutamate--homocysteine methyltransferase
MAPPRIRTTTVGSYPVPDWLVALPSEQARLDATRVIFDVQRQAGIDLPTDGELYRFDVNQPETNGMIDYFIRPLAGISAAIGGKRLATVCRNCGVRLSAQTGGHRSQ